MSLTPAELAANLPRALVLARELRSALDPDGDGGRRLTRAERRRLVRVLGEMLVALGVDALD